MELKWNKFIWQDNKTYPKESGYYLIFCVYASSDGKWYQNKRYAYYKKRISVDKTNSLAGDFDLTGNNTGNIILYWADAPDPEDFKKDFPF